MPPTDGGPFGQFHEDDAHAPLTMNTSPLWVWTPWPPLAVTFRLSLLPMSPRSRRIPPWPSMVRPAEFAQTPLWGAILLRQKVWSPKPIGSRPAVAPPARGWGWIPSAPPRNDPTWRATPTKSTPKLPPNRPPGRMDAAEV